MDLEDDSMKKSYEQAIATLQTRARTKACD
jgi:hypothetical protein